MLSQDPIWPQKLSTEYNFSLICDGYGDELNFVAKFATKIATECNFPETTHLVTEIGDGIFAILVAKKKYLLQNSDELIFVGNFRRNFPTNIYSSLFPSLCCDKIFF